MSSSVLVMLLVMKCDLSSSIFTLGDQTCRRGERWANYWVVGFGSSSLDETHQGISHYIGNHKTWTLFFRKPLRNKCRCKKLNSNSAKRHSSRQWVFDNDKEPCCKFEQTVHQEKQLVQCSTLAWNFGEQTWFGKLKRNNWFFFSNQSYIFEDS